MKKNILGAIVVFFVTIACLLVIDDISNSKNTEHQDTVNTYQAEQQPDLAITDQ